MRRSPWAVRVRVVAVLGVAALLCGCASVGSVRSASLLEGTQLEFEAGFTETCEAARLALQSLGFDLAEQYEPTETTWVIIGASGMSLMSYGEYVRVTVEQIEENRTAARVYTKVKVATNVLAKRDYSSDVYAAMLAFLED